MYYFLTEAVKRRFIMELRNFWSYHPKYRDIVDHIQGKYSFRERPQMGIVLKTSSANHVVLAADNYQGVVYSYVHLAKVERTPDQGGGVFPGQAVEWVREDARAIADNGGLFPSDPGIYYIDILPSGQEFYVDPLVFVEDEPVMQTSPTEFQLQAGKFLANTLRLYEMPGNIELFSPQNYTADPDTGIITLTGPLPDQVSLSADYKYPGASTGPWAIRENFATNKPIPGVVLAFGRRVEGGDRLGVVVQSARKQAALEYGGRWNVTIDFDVLARDEYAQQEITDRTVQWLWAVLRSRLSGQGIEIEEVSMGGETEEVYDETGDDYYYNASFTLTCQTDWSLHVPMSACIRRVQPNTVEQSKIAASLPEAELADADLSNIVVVEDLGLNLKNWDDPFFRLGRGGYETIK
jgi:hypothetical protein